MEKARAACSSISILLLIAVVRVYCCTRKIMKETEMEQTIGFVSSFVSLIAFQLERGGRGPWLPLRFNNYRTSLLSNQL